MAEETTTSEAPATESGAEDNAGILSIEDLAASFAERVESEAEGEPSETEATEAGSEAESADAVEEEEDVLSQSISQEDDEEDDEAEEESEGEPEGESPAVGRLLKQVGKLTARAKGAEETVEALKAEVVELKSQPDGERAQAPGAPILADIGNLDGLEKVRQEALSAKKWAMGHLGKDYVQDGEREYDGDEIRRIFSAAEEYLTEKIPARGQFLQTKTQWDADALETFPYLKTEEGPMFELYQELRFSPIYQPVFDSLAQGNFAAGVFAKGIKAVREEQAGKAKKKPARAKPPSSQGGDAAPPVQSKKARQQNRKNKALGKGVISEGQLAAYLTE